jgi:hypothetical protein
MAEAAQAAASDTTATASTASNGPWYNGVPGVTPEVVGHWQSKGWDKKTPQEVAVEASKAWKEAERFVGAPASELLRIPKDQTDEAGWNAIYTRLGKPQDAKEYDFSNVKFSDGTPLDNGFSEFMRTQAFRLNLPKNTALELTNEFAKYLDNAETSEKNEAMAKLVEEKQKLSTNWGPNFEANKFIAGRAAAALGVSPETVSQLESVVGYAAIMDMFLKIGTKIGEDKFVTGGRESGNGVMTREQAIARKAELMADKVWVKGYLDKDAAKLREMTALNTMIVGTQG